MSVHTETVLLADAARIELTLWGEPGARARYRLRYGRPGAWLVQYDNEDGRGDRRIVGARSNRYEFRSIEQLRYDFERDIEAWSDGEEARA
jgi:hypothetical protein